MVSDDELGQLAVEMTEMTELCRDGHQFPECCIYRVPYTLRHLDEEAYTPKVISIGPFHHASNRRLRDMERYKQIMFKRFHDRSGLTMDTLVSMVRDLEPDVRASYSEAIALDKREFVKLILLDAAFIIELFLLDKKDEMPNDVKLFQSWLGVSIQQDLILVENQLPFFAIEQLFDKALLHRNDGEQLSFFQLTYDYFQDFNTNSVRPSSNVRIEHFTDLIRSFHLQENVPERSPSRQAGRHILLFNASALQERGIKLKASSRSLLDIQLSGHVLEIPKIAVEAGTKLLFRNMIALEQCHYPEKTYITDYALLLDCLIDRNNDVDLLVSKKIVWNYLGDSRNVTFLFNGLGGHFTGQKFNSEYLEICENLTKHCKDPLHEMRATLKRDYCRTPWQVVASIAAIILLILTVVQTVFSILQVVK